MVTIHIPRGLVASFRRIAKQTYPNEAFAYLVGEVTARGVVVEGLAHPSYNASPTAVNVSASEHARLVKEVKPSRLVGTIHSHPEWSAEPSTHDIRNAAQCGEVVYGVMAVWEEGGRLRTRCEFYLGTPPMKVKRT